MINPTREMIVLKGEIRTSAVQSCQYNQITKKWDVIFSSGKKFSYAYDNVEKLYNPSILDLTEYQLQEGGEVLKNIETAYVFSGRNKYYHLIYENGYYKDYSDRDIRLVKSAFETKKSKDVWQYFNRIAEISNLRDEFGEKILKRQYEKIGFISEDNALDPYLNQKKAKTRKGRIPIFPFGCNTSQYTAVENAINNQLSVIQGPPGTGKTQTILNIIANLLVAGQNVQVVSNNNSAIENVQEKLDSPKYNLGFIVAKLGKGDNKKQFVQEQTTEYPDFSGWKYNGNEFQLLSEIRELSQKLKTVYADQEQVAKLSYEKSGIEVERKHFDEYIKETNTELVPIKLRKSANSSSILSLWQIWLERDEKDEVTPQS